MLFPNKKPLELMKVRDAARILNVSPKHIYRLIDAGLMCVVNVGVSPERPIYRIKHEDLEAFQHSEMKL